MPAHSEKGLENGGDVTQSELGGAEDAGRGWAGEVEKERWW